MKLFQIYNIDGSYNGWINLDKVEVSGEMVPYQYDLYRDGGLIGILRDVKIEES